MPLIKLQVTEELPEEKKQGLLADISSLVAEGIGKPEHYVMALVESADIIMSGTSGPAAFADIRSIGGLTGTVNQTISSRLCALLEEKIGIPGNRVYINFTDVPASQWGTDGRTFG